MVAFFSLNIKDMETDDSNYMFKTICLIVSLGLGRKSGIFYVSCFYLVSGLILGQFNLNFIPSLSVKVVAFTTMHCIHCFVTVSFLTRTSDPFCGKNGSGADLK